MLDWISQIKLFADRRGYVAILVAVFIPVILFGMKYVMDNKLLHRALMNHKNTDKIYKNCAKEAALGVAKYWNTGLTLNEQRESLLRIADGIYNNMPAHYDSVIDDAIPGLDRIEGYRAEQSGGPFSPLHLKVNNSAGVSPQGKTIEYKDMACFLYREKFTDDGTSILEVYRRMYFLIKKPYILFEDAVCDFIPFYSPTNTNTLSFYSLYMGTDVTSNIPMNYIAGFCRSSEPRSYTQRVNANDTTLQISVDDDRIKVITDNDIGYAIPAECNVDIVLSIPTNAAACNKDNLDSSSTTAGSPTITTADTSSIISSTTLAARSDVKNMRQTPIYQIAQAYRTFLKNNFKYTRGVNVGLIPYSGKISIPPDRDTVWVENFPSFDPSYFLSNQNMYLHRIRGIFLYGTSGTAGSSLKNGYGSWGGYSPSETSGGYGIMFRGPKTIESTYGNNYMCVGDLLSTASAESYKFRKMNYNPCYLGYANFLSMKCENNCQKYMHNPFFFTELMADVERVYDLLNVFIPFNDDRNVSNFVFLPITFANNMFQSWTKDPSKVASNTVGGTGGGQLAHPSKQTPNRKKALILIVNKPDYFEHEELTYLGFDNDFSEIPMMESDCIRFDINYSDTSKKFMDGTNYNGTIQGTKKILKYETVSGTVTRNAESGYYECDGTAAGRLSFPQKGLVKVVVEVGGKNSEITWTLKENNSLPEILSSGIWGVCYGNGKLVACSAYGNFYVSQDKGSSWAMSNKLSQTYDWMDICYADGNFIAVSNGGYIASSTDGVSWILHGPIEKVPDTSLMGVCYGNGKLVALTLGGYILTGKLDDLSNWKCDGSSIPGAGGCIRIIYVDGYYLTMSGKGAAISLESDETDLWATIWATIKTIPFPSYALCYANQKVVIIDYRSMLVSENKGRSWGCYSVLPSGDSWDNLCHDGENFIAVGYNGLIAVGSYENVTATIKFTNITDGNLTKNNEEYKISNRRELYIEPSQISGTEGNYYIDFSMKNIRLISAEITNRPYSTAGEVVPTTEVTYLDFDIVDFSKGRTSGDVLSYSQTSGSSAYEPGKGYATSNGIGRITLSKPGNVILTVDKLESTTGLTSVSSSWLDSTIAYGNGRWIVLNNIEGFVAVSTDNGVTWIRRGSINGFTSPVRRQVSYGDGKWVALDITGRIVLSEDDGSKWDIIDILPSSASQWSVMRWSNNLGWLALSSDGIVFSGRIRERWERMSSMTAVSTHGWSTAFCNNNDVWAAINSETGAVVIASERDIEYRMRSSLTDSFWYGLDYGNNIWMALNKNGIIATSEGDVTGWNWNIKSTLISSFGSNRWECLCYGDRKWMAVSYQGVVAISEDNGTTWTKQSGGLSTAASAITINSTRQEISGKTSIVISSEQFTQSGSSYVLDINMENIKLVSAKADYNQTETVNDLMMFYSSQESFNRILTYSGSGVWDAYKLYRCSGSGTITSLLKGEIRLTVGPALDTSSSTIQFTSGSDTAVKNITGIQTLTINSSDLVKGSNDNYSVSFNASNISLIKAKLIAEESGGGMQYLPIPSPEMSRVVNFSKNVGGKPEYDKNFIVYGSDTNGSLGSTGVKWDSDISSWVTAPSYGHQYSGSNHFYMNNIAGDFYLNIEDMGNTIPEWFMFVKNINYDSRQPTYNLSGNFRFFSHFSNLYEVSHAHFDIRNAAENANCVLQVGGFTLPVNTALYYGANGSSMHSYQWQSNSSGNLITYDSLVATQQVTTSACNKLKSDWGNNLRIYLIKYRKQSSYKNKINNATINFDYGYIDQCASGSEYIYDVSTDDGLSSVLQTIADDIKSFAGHEGAKNVE